MIFAFILYFSTVVSANDLVPGTTTWWDSDIPYYEYVDKAENLDFAQSYQPASVLSDFLKASVIETIYIQDTHREEEALGIEEIESMDDVRDWLV